METIALLQLPVDTRHTTHYHIGLLLMGIITLLQLPIVTHENLTL